MATILPRRRADGTVGYISTVRLHDGTTLVHRESKTLSRRVAAEKWARAREVELEDPAALVRACAGDVTLASLITPIGASFLSGDRHHPRQLPDRGPRRVIIRIVRSDDGLDDLV